MNKLIILGFAVSLGAAKLAFLAADPPVNLQASSPGTAQTGHLNIVGTATVGLLKSRGTVFGASTSPTGFAYGGFFTAASDQGRGFYGFASSPTGLTYGGFFQNASNQGRAVYGLNTATGGTTFGGYFQSASPAGRGLFGVATAISGTNYGVYGRSFSPSGFGVFSEGNMGATGVISGNGSGLTNLNAANLFGTIFLAGTGNEIIRGDNTDPTGTGGGITGVTEGLGTGVAGVANKPTGAASGVLGMSSGSAGSGVFGYALHASGVNYGLRGKTNSPNGFGVYSEGKMHATGVISGNGSGLTYLNASNLDTGRISNGLLPVPMLLLGDVAADSVLFANNFSTTNGTAITGIAHHTGGNFDSNGSSGFGVAAHAYGSGNATGVLAEVSSSTGTAVWANAYSQTGVNYGLRAISQSTEGIAGLFSGRGADAVTVVNNGTGRGIRATTSADTAMWATTTSGFAAVDGRNARTDGYALYGKNTGTTGFSMGVVGRSDSATTGYGVYAWGALGASGTKAFMIDHPVDPENKFLLHYSAESPTPQNFYSGNTKTDARGRAWVELPSYFAEINANFKYQLTVLDDSESAGFVQVKVGRKIQGNRFLIMSSLPNVEVSWRVEADRNDRWVRKHGAPTEIEKTGNLGGTFQHPDLYGFGPEREVNYQRETGRLGTRQPHGSEPNKMR